MKKNQFQPVVINYNKCMLPYFNDAKHDMEQDGHFFEGIGWEVVNDKLVLTISQEQREGYLIALGIKVGKLMSAPKLVTIGELEEKGLITG